MALQNMNKPAPFPQPAQFPNMPNNNIGTGNESWWDNFLSAFEGPMMMGSEQKVNRIPIVQPNQMEAINSQLQSGLTNVNRNASFSPTRENAIRSYDQYGAPSIRGRFEAMGLGQSPRLQQAVQLGRSNLESNLAQQEQGWNAQQQQLGMQQLNYGQNPMFANQIVPAQQGLVQQIVPMIAKALMAYATGGASMGGGDIEKVLSQLLKGMSQGQQQDSGSGSGNYQNQGNFGDTGNYSFGPNSGYLPAPKHNWKF